MRSTLHALCGLVLLAPAAAAQHEHEHSPYADQPSSGIASLSVTEMEDLRNGAGMGLARAAELNHYPGPKHVLDLADSLGLTPEQHANATAIFEHMQERAQELGERIIAAEEMLSRRFEHEHIDSATVESSTAEIGRLYGELRYVHLAAHLALKRLLTAQQIAAYDRLRGYATSM
jgi:Spy/CpxP family protein refolding chaperone